jgi:transposase
MAKYPGFSILYEVGSRKELALSYGVSERTIYRWLNRAAAESGITPKLTAKFPGAKKIEAFKGTRKQLAAKYGVSERTAYRWINKAKAQGASIPSRANKSKYPGEQILYEVGTNKELAQSYGVSPRTVSRWKKKARDKQEIDQINRGLPEEIITEPEVEELGEFPEEIITEPEIEEPEIEPEGKEFEDESQQTLYDITERLLNPDNELLSDNSIFKTLSVEEQMDYIDMYLQYQCELDEHQFYNPETHKMDFSPDFVSNINIWGDEFEDWAQKQHDYGMYEIPY